MKIIKIILSVVFILVFSIFLLGCEKENNYRFEKSNLGMLSSANEFTDDRLKEVNEEKASVVRKFIKNGKIIFETEDLNKTKNQIVFLLKKHNGYISSDSQNEYDNRRNAHLEIRIPAKNFETILLGISEEVKEFDVKEIKISDVTEKFLDIQARLKNKKELEKRYLEILKKTKNVKEILDVEKEIGKLREDIEVVEGKLKYLENQVSFSTLNISFYKIIAYETNFGKKLKEGFKNGFDNLKLFFISLINIWPFIIILFCIIYFFRRWRKKRKRSNI